MLGIIAILVLTVATISVVSAAMRTTTTEEQAFSPDGIDTLDVSGQAGSITIVVVDRDDIAVTTRLTSTFWQRLSTDRQISDRTLSISSDCTPTLVFSTCSAEHQIALPRDAVGTIRLTTTAGSIHVDGATADVEVATTAGSVRLSDFAGETAQLRSTAGEISVQAVSAPRLLEARTTAGEIDIRVPDEVYDVSADTTVGDIDVGVSQDPDAERRISATTTAGSISIASR